MNFKILKMYFGISDICQTVSSTLEALKLHASTNQPVDAAPAGGDGIPLVLSAKEVGPGRPTVPRSRSRDFVKERMETRC